MDQLESEGDEGGRDSGSSPHSNLSSLDITPHWSIDHESNNQTDIHQPQPQQQTHWHVHSLPPRLPPQQQQHSPQPSASGQQHSSHFHHHIHQQHRPQHDPSHHHPHPPPQQQHTPQQLHRQGPMLSIPPSQQTRSPILSTHHPHHHPHNATPAPSWLSNYNTPTVTSQSGAMHNTISHTTSTTSSTAASEGHTPTPMHSHRSTSRASSFPSPNSNAGSATIGFQLPQRHNSQALAATGLQHPDDGSRPGLMLAYSSRNSMTISEIEPYEEAPPTPPLPAARPSLAICIPGSRAPRTYHVFNGAPAVGTPGASAATGGSGNGRPAGESAHEVYVVLEQDPDDEPYSRHGSSRRGSAVGSHGVGGGSVPRSLLGSFLGGHRSSNSLSTYPPHGGPSETLSQSYSNHHSTQVLAPPGSLHHHSHQHGHQQQHTSYGSLGHLSHLGGAGPAQSVPHPPRSHRDHDYGGLPTAASRALGSGRSISSLLGAPSLDIWGSSGASVLNRASGTLLRGPSAGTSSWASIVDPPNLPAGPSPQQQHRSGIRHSASMHEVNRMHSSNAPDSSSTLSKRAGGSTDGFAQHHHNNNFSAARHSGSNSVATSHSNSNSNMALNGGGGSSAHLQIPGSSLAAACTANNSAGYDDEYYEGMSPGEYQDVMRGGRSRYSREPSLTDIALLASSLPGHNSGGWGFSRPPAAKAAAAANEAISRRMSRSSSYSSMQQACSLPGAGDSSLVLLGGGSSGLVKGLSGVIGGGSCSGGFAGAAVLLPGVAEIPPEVVSFPICLICLEMLTPEDFDSGGALSLQCGCRGDIALRHRSCAIEWSNHKGDLNCDICKRLITNLPAIDPAILEAKEEARRRRLPNFSIDAAPSSADYIFDCVRVAWIAMIVLILVLDLPVNQAMMYGAVMGIAYVVLAKSLNACTHAVRAHRVRRQVANAGRAQQQQLRQQLPSSTGQGLRQPLLSEV